jgi:hypothetical protein
LTTKQVFQPEHAARTSLRRSSRRQVGNVAAEVDADPGVAAARAFSLIHGAYSTVHLGKRAAQLAAETRDTMPVYEYCDEHAVWL